MQPHFIFGAILTVWVLAMLGVLPAAIRLAHAVALKKRRHPHGTTRPH